MASSKEKPIHADNILPFKERTERDSLLDPRPSAPADTCRLAYCIFFLHGVGHLLPWNFFITAQLVRTAAVLLYTLVMSHLTLPSVLPGKVYLSPWQQHCLLWVQFHFRELVQCGVHGANLCHVSCQRLVAEQVSHFSLLSCETSITFSVYRFHYRLRMVASLVVMLTLFLITTALVGVPVASCT